VLAQAYTALYKSDATAPESPFSRSSMTALQTFSSISSQGSRRLSPPSRMQPTLTLSSSLSSPNLKVPVHIAFENDMDKSDHAQSKIVLSEVRNLL
jgi:hypothetical protein